MKTRDLMKMLDEGVQPVIKFTQKITDIDGQPDPEMMGKVIGYRDEESWDENRNDVTIFIDIDLNEFETYNKTKAKSNWYDDKGVANLTWFDCGMYPKNGIESICVMLVENSEESGLDYFEIVELSKYFKEYQVSDFKGTYAQFLEKKLDELNGDER
jgi:hypothetical protein